MDQGRWSLRLRPRLSASSIASIVLSANVPLTGTQDVVGRLFKATNGSIEILFKFSKGTLSQPTSIPCTK